MNFYKRSYQPILRYLYAEAIKRQGEISLHKHFNNLFQTCYNKLGTSSANTTCWQPVRFYACSGKLASCRNSGRKHLRSIARIAYMACASSDHRYIIRDYPLGLRFANSDQFYITIFLIKRARVRYFELWMIEMFTCFNVRQNKRIFCASAATHTYHTFYPLEISNIEWKATKS